MAVQADLLRGTPLTAMVNANRRQPTQLDLYNERRRKEIQSQSNQFQKLAFDLRGLQAKQQQQALENQLAFAKEQREIKESKATIGLSKAKRKKVEAETANLENERTLYDTTSPTPAMKNKTAFINNYIIRHGPAGDTPIFKKDDIPRIRKILRSVQIPAGEANVDGLFDTAIISAGFSLPTSKSAIDINASIKNLTKPLSYGVPTVRDLRSRINKATELLAGDKTLTFRQKAKLEQIIKSNQDQVSTAQRGEGNYRTQSAKTYQPLQEQLSAIDSAAYLFDLARNKDFRANSTAAANLRSSLSEVLSYSASIGGDLATRAGDVFNQFLQGEVSDASFESMEEVLKSIRRKTINQMSNVIQNAKNDLGSSSHPYIDRFFPSPAEILSVLADPPTKAAVSNFSKALTKAAEFNPNVIETQLSLLEGGDQTTHDSVMQNLTKKQRGNYENFNQYIAGTLGMSPRDFYSHLRLLVQKNLRDESILQGAQRGNTPD